LKTDQDNGLLLRDGYLPPSDLPAICARFTEALACFGYPACKGLITVSNADWRASASDFTEKACHWLLRPDGANVMALAIFLDAHAVAGDAALLATVRERVLGLVTDNDAMIAHFAKAIDAFAGDGGSWWSRLLARGEADHQPFDLKKQGIFPIVHGVRSLALSARLAETSTAARLEALVVLGSVERSLATDVLESLHFFMGLRLKAGLVDIDRGRAVSGQVDPARLSSLERDLLKDTLDVVKRLRQLLHARFRLDAL
jgi:CBS domain-containing protein